MSEYIVDFAAHNINAAMALCDGVHGEVVRCGDCKWCVEDGAFFDCRHFSCHISWNEGQEPDGFCAWGERKVEE